MPLVSMQKLLNLSKQQQCALGCMSVYNLESIQGVLAAAELKSTPVMLSIGNEAICHAGLHALGCAAISAARMATVPVAVHLNHGRSLDRILEALDLGFNSVMFDGSNLSFSENLIYTRRAAQLAHDVNAAVEGELGPIGGPIFGAEDKDATQLAEIFATETQIDLLAFSIPKGGLKSLDAIHALKQKLKTPLVIHGASQLGPNGTAILSSMGIDKINFHSEIKQALGSSFQYIEKKRNMPIEVLCTIREAVSRVACNKLSNLRYSKNNNINFMCFNG
ncbi:MAG: class II fructose-bisphosphate aldolase [Dissulfuribacterales bacterium]